MTKECLPKELVKRQKTLEQKVEKQDSLIRRFYQLIRHEGLFSQVISNFPYPIAIFEQSGTLIMANQMLLQKTGISLDNVEEKNHLLSHIVNEKTGLMETVANVFRGETVMIKDIAEPLAFSTEDTSLIDNNDGYQKAVFFPIYENDGDIFYGAVMLMK